MKYFSYDANELTTILGAEQIRYSHRPIQNAVISSQKAEDGSIFFPFAGTHTDGHLYFTDAIHRGASAICLLRGHPATHSLPDGDYSIFLVENMQTALWKFAEYHRRQHTGLRIAVTGSNGKTTTKEYLRAIFEKDGSTFATKGNYNNELGVPLSLLSIKKDCNYAILEAGMSNAKEIEFLSLLIAPHYACITNIGTAHIASLKTRAAIAKAKLEILCGLKTGGRLFYPSEEPLFAGQFGTTIGFSKQADYRIGASNLILTEESPLPFTKFNLFHKGASYPLCIRAVGQHNIYDASLAFACSMEYGIDPQKATEALLEYESIDMRQQWLNFGSITVLNDCYNASPESMEASLLSLCAYAKKKKKKAIAVLGDMLELGEQSTKLHEKIGVLASQLPLSALYTIGKKSLFLANTFQKSDPSITCLSFSEDNMEEVAELLKKEEKEGAVVLIKGSREMRLERLISLFRKD